METTIATGFRCSRPLPDLNKLTLMFETLELQNLNKLPKGKIGDFPSPEAFHAVKVQRLGRDTVKSPAQVGRKFPMPIFALVGNFAIQACEASDATPPVLRTFHLSGKAFVERPKCFQGVLQRLRMLDFLTGVESEIGVVLNAEVYAYALTCSSNRFGCEIVSDDIKPIRANAITKDLDIADVVSCPIAVMVIQNVSTDKSELLFTCLPFFEGQTDRPFREFVARLELRRTETSFAFELRQPTESAEKTLVGRIQSDNHSVKRVARYPCPVLLGAFQQLRQVRLQAIPSGILSIYAVITLLQLQEVVMYIAKVIEKVAQTLILRMFAYLIFIGSQGFTSYQSLSPVKWDGRHIVKRQCFTCLPTGKKSLAFLMLFVKKKRAGIPPQPKGWGLPPEER